MTKQLAVHDGNSNAAASITPFARPPRGRASWTGLLQFSLVVVPVKAYPVVSTTETIQFNQLHADCGQRIRYEKHCPSHGKVEASSIVRGYQYAPHQYVVIEASELDKLRPAKEKALQLEQFVDADQVDPAMFSGRSLYLFPHGLPAHRPYLVLAQAMRQRNCWAVGRVVMSGQAAANTTGVRVGSEPKRKTGGCLSEAGHLGNAASLLRSPISGLDRQRTSARHQLRSFD